MFPKESSKEIIVDISRKDIMNSLTAEIDIKNKLLEKGIPIIKEDNGCIKVLFGTLIKETNYLFNVDRYIWKDNYRSFL